MKNSPPSTWRLLKTEPANGHWNMAVDEALLSLMATPDTLPVFRVYSWKPPCLSLGYAQPLSEVDQNGLKANGWDLVRRATGGRAILHTDELTYSVITPVAEPRMAGGVLESYKRLSTALFAALKSLELPVDISEVKVKPKKEIDPVCFDVPSIYEITLNGKKIIGSAQARKASGILQHGTFPLTGDLTRITQGLKYPSLAAQEEARQKILQKAVTAQIGDRILTWEQAAEAFIQAFSDILNINFVEQELKKEELELINQFVEQKREIK